MGTLESFRVVSFVFLVSAVMEVLHFFEQLLFLAQKCDCTSSHAFSLKLDHGCEVFNALRCANRIFKKYNSIVYFLKK